MLVTDVNSEVAGYMNALVTDVGSGNEKQVFIGGLNADTLNISSSNALYPELVISAPPLSEPIPA